MKTLLCLGFMVASATGAASAGSERVPAPSGATQPVATQPAALIRVSRFHATLPPTETPRADGRLPMSRCARINFELALQAARPLRTSLTGALEVECRTPDGRRIAMARDVLLLAAGRARFVHSGHWELPRGAWPPGEIQVRARFDDQAIGGGRFAVFDDRDRRRLFASPIADPRVRLFVGGVEPGSRRYATRFGMSRTSVVGWELVVRNNLYMLLDTTEWLVVRWVGPDGRLIASRRRRVALKRDVFEVRLWSRYGYDEPARWRPGAYRIEFEHDGKRLVQAAFQVVDDRDPAGLDRQPVDVRRVRFFASNDSRRRPSQRVYTERLRMSTTTSIGWELELRHRRFGYAPTSGLLLVRWFGPFESASAATQPAGRGAKPLWVQRASLLLKQDQTFGWRRADWGFDEPGHWLPGVYRAEFHFQGRRLAAGTVTVYDDRDPARQAAIGLVVERLEFYRPRRPPQVRPVVTPAQVADLRWRLTCRNPLYGLRAATHVVELRWFTKDGLLLSEREIRLPVGREHWRVARSGLVADILGSKPIEGAYCVEIWRGGRLEGRAELEVAAEVGPGARRRAP